MCREDREIMIRDQLEARGIIDKRVLDAFRKVKRHLFVREEDRLFAYDDCPQPIGAGQTISQPYIVALMIQLLRLEGNERVLEIGTGCGYQTALLAELARDVFTVERIGSLSGRAKKLLKRLCYQNVVYRIGDGTAGWKEYAPFDHIIVSAASPRIPKLLFEQLAAGGRMVAPIGGKYSQQLSLITKTEDGEQEIKNRGGCVFVPLVGENGWQDG